MNPLARLFIPVACAFGAMAQTTPSTPPTPRPTSAPGRGPTTEPLTLVRGQVRESYTITFPGTHLRVTFPGDWRRVRRILAYSDPMTGAEALARESRLPFSAVDQGLAKETNLEENRETRVEGRNARFLRVTRTVGGKRVITRTLVVGNAVASASLAITCPEDRDAEVAPTVMSILASATWDPARDAHASAVMPFAYDPQGLRAAGADAASITYTETGRVRTEELNRPLLKFGVRPKPATVSLEQARTVFENLGGPPGTAKVVECVPLTVGEMKGFEGQVEVTARDVKLTAYVAQLIDDDCEYIVLGQCGPEAYKAASEKFKKAARSIKALSSKELNDPDR